MTTEAIPQPTETGELRGAPYLPENDCRCWPDELLGKVLALSNAGSSWDQACRQTYAPVVTNLSLWLYIDAIDDAVKAWTEFRVKAGLA